MSRSRVRISLSPERTPGLATSPAPFENARRWRSVYEEDSLHGWPGIFMTGEAYQGINEHADSDLAREVGGMLVGQVRQTLVGHLYVIVEAHLPARHVHHGPVHVTFTSNTLADLLDRREEEFPQSQVVGWYHTHPGFSVFLSQMDVWLHTHFFPQRWHVALVIDSIAQHGGFFRRTDESNGLNPHCHIGFYELIEPGATSVVSWKNVLPEPVVDEQ